MGKQEIEAPGTEIQSGKLKRDAYKCKCALCRYLIHSISQEAKLNHKVFIQTKQSPVGKKILLRNRKGMGNNTRSQHIATFLSNLK